MDRSTRTPFAPALALVAFVLAACGSKTAPPPQTARTQPVEAPEEGAGLEQTTSRIESFDVGSSDGPVARATFETSTGAIAPGVSFLVAAHFEIADGYRLSWINPGDMGEQIAIEFGVPEGFEVSTPMFPGPERFELPDGYVSYGYADETAVFAEVRVPPNVVPNEVYRFELSAQWLACRGTCVKEATNAFFEIVATADPVEQGFEGALQALLGHVPQPLSALDQASLEWRETGTLAITAAGVTWKDYFPASASQPAAEQVAFGRGGHEMLLRFAQAQPGAAVQGVLLAEVDGQQRYVALDEHLPAGR